jgi:outer membrane receptor protein involved in Fe transport
LFYDGPSGSWMQGIDAGAVVHFVGQYWDNSVFTFADLRPRPGFPTDPNTGDCSKFDFLIVGGAGGVPGAPIPHHHGPIGVDPNNPFFPCQGTLDRKVREWVTLDLILNYTFNLPPPAAQNEVAGYAKDGGKNVKMKDGKEKNVMPISTAEYNPCGWRSFLNNVTITVGMDNVTDEQPPFVASAFENGYDQQTANNKGRLWYVGIKKRF